MAHNNCPICLDALCSSSASSIGVATPCGHCFHRSCFQKWADASTHRSLRAMRNYDGTDICPKCPTCNTLVDKFVDIYLNFTTVGSTSVDKRSTTVDLIDIEDNGGGTVAVADQNLIDEHNSSKRLLKKHAEEIINLRTQVNSLKDGLENAETQVTTLEDKQGRLKGQLEFTIKEHRQKERSVSKLLSRVDEADIKTEKATRKLHELGIEYKRNLEMATINSMAEVKEIAERDKKRSQNYDDLLKHVRSQEIEIEDLQEEHVRMMKLMRRDVDTKLEAKRKNGKVVISQQMKAKIVADTRRAFDLEQDSRAKEAISVRKRSKERAMMKNGSAQASRAFKAARISSNIYQSAPTKVIRSVTMTSQSSDVRNTYRDGNNTTSSKVKSSVNVDDFNPSSMNINRNRSVNAILSHKPPARHFVRGKLQRKTEERPSSDIKKFFSVREKRNNK